MRKGASLTPHGTSTDEPEQSTHETIARDIAKHWAWTELVRAITERFGPSAGVLVFMLLTAKVLGSEDTQDEFFRAVVFGEKGWGLPLMTFILLLDVAAGVRLFQRLFRLSDSEEKERVIKERNRLQEELLNRKLSHTMKEPGDD
jgi:hypothetical protein